MARGQCLRANKHEPDSPVNLRDYTLHNCLASALLERNDRHKVQKVIICATLEAKGRENGAKEQKLAREEEEEEHKREGASLSRDSRRTEYNINMSPSIPPPSCKSEDPAASSGLMTPDSLRPPPASHRTRLEQTENHSAACLDEYLMG
ncbi:hypothetical protein ROHU_024476 [Labeo rohita]|uniref:Uncharacterized protein n=1 Tax=Labeo rohita TaxID=84645 RepID=A0A498MLH4_LABRO|nr:hypothetical protein ROHU_024476 [Labeo rohita]